MPGVSHRNVGVSPKPKSEPDMSMAIEARASIGAIKEFIAPSMPLKAALPRVAAYIGLNARRVRAIWHSEARSLLAEEFHAMQAARARIAERIITRDIHNHARQLESYAARLALVDADLHGAEVARLRGLAQRARDFLAGEEGA